MKPPTDPHPPKASAGRSPETPKASAGQVPPPPTRASSLSPSYDDGVVHHPHDDGTGHDDLHNEDVAHEHSDVNLRAILGSAVVLAVVVAVSMVLMILLFNTLEKQAEARDPHVSPLAAPPTNMPKTTNASPVFSVGVGGPQLLSNEPKALANYRAGIQKQLQFYGWVDEKTGVAHIPIDAAKKLILEKGLPVREGTTVPEFRVRPEARGESSGGRTVMAEPPETETAPAAQPPAQAQPATPHGPGGH
jgi:hypothetical protein